MIENTIIDYMKNKELKFSLVFKGLKNNKNEVSINEERRVPSASIIKIFIMAKAFDMAKKGELDLSLRIKVKNEHRVPFSIVYLLDENTTYTIKDLIILMIIQSDNTATNVLIDFFTMEKINEFIKQNGFKDTFVKRRMMDFETRQAGIDNETSAADVSRFLELAYEGKLVSKEASIEMLQIMKQQLDFSMMRINLPDELVIAHKTGDLSNIKNDTGIVYTEKGEYIFCMFTWNAKSDNYARNILGKVSAMLYEYFTKGDVNIENY